MELSQDQYSFFRNLHYCTRNNKKTVTFLQFTDFLIKIKTVNINRYDYLFYQAQI